MEIGRTQAVTQKGSLGKLRSKRSEKVIWERKERKTKHDYEWDFVIKLWNNPTVVQA